MINITFDKESPIVTFEPEGELKESDFEILPKILDPFIKIHKRLDGFVVLAETFPPYEEFAACLGYLKFVKNQHKKVKRIALVTDSPIGEWKERLAEHFIAAEIRRFPYDAYEEAKRWVKASENDDA